jgi:hypothetical protein
MAIGTPSFLFQLCLNFKLSQLLVMMVDACSFFSQLSLTTFAVGDGD